jgi:hypothetical protein
LYSPSPVGRALEAAAIVMVAVEVILRPAVEQLRCPSKAHAAVVACGWAVVQHLVAGGHGCGLYWPKMNTWLGWAWTRAV